MNNPIGKLCSFVVIVHLFASAAAGAEPTEKKEVSADKNPAGIASKVPWPQGLDSGRRRAKAEGRPLLVRVGADWCPWCDKLSEHIEVPEVQAELRQWTLAYVNSDRANADVGQLGVGPIPALRALDANGKIVGEQDGYISQEVLLDWLKKMYKLAVVATPAVLTADAPLEEKDLRELVDLLRAPSPLDREAALRRLAPHRNLAAIKVTDALARGKLAARLSALELLGQWHAPIEEIDPWRPETLSGARLEALQQWANEQANQVVQQSTLKISEAELASATREVDRLAQASDAQAEAINERLARFRAALLPLIAARLKEASGDVARERLLTLRYRLVASDGIALNWPGGLTRLASTDASLRHKAAADLVDRATAADEALLLELFSDPDPLVREISLRGLQNVGGDASSGALLKLLDDPEPNVRAAVLKQLAEEPDNVVPRIAEYVASEKDADLVVHAIRVLKAAKATKPLIELLKHESWQVRAEAAESLATVASEQSNESTKADIYVALIECLADDDGFVVSRAIHGLEGAQLTAAVEPLVKAANDHPDLVPEVIQALAAKSALRSKAEPFLWKSLGHPEPQVRSRVISALAAANVDDIDRVLIDGLKDSASQVRQAAADSLFTFFETEMKHANESPVSLSRRQAQPQGVLDFIKSLFSAKPPSPVQEAGKPAGDENSPEQNEEEPDDGKTGDAWLLTYRQGKSRPAWTNDTTAKLEKMLSAESPRERLAAALAIIPLGRDELALKVLNALVRTEPNYAAQASAALPWLLWTTRLKFFDELLLLKPDTTQVGQIAGSLAKNKTPRATKPLWEILARDDVDSHLASAMYASLSNLYRGESTAHFGTAPVHVTKAEKAQIIGYAENGRPWQKNIALAMLVELSIDDAVQAAQKVIEDPHTSDDFRGDALQLWLLASEPGDATRIAVKQIASTDAALRKRGLLYLARGAEALRRLRHDINIQSSFHPMSGTFNEAVSIEAPKGVTEALVRPLLSDPDAEVAASAAYVLATLGNDEGLPILVGVWRKQRAGSNWAVPVYRAIAALDNDDNTPVLVEINKKLSPWEKSEFYWTIRSMHGPKVFKLRKQIRDEVGMDALR